MFRRKASSTKGERGSSRECTSYSSSDRSRVLLEKDGGILDAQILFQGPLWSHGQHGKPILKENWTLLAYMTTFEKAVVSVSKM